MHAADKLVVDTEDRKNALEEFIYDTRGKLDERYKLFVQPQEKEVLLSMLAAQEDWLYSEEGEDATKSAYVTRLEDLQKQAHPVYFRWKQHEERPAAAAQLREVVNKYTSIFENEPEKYDHLSDDDKMKVIEKAANTSKWLDDYMYKQSELPKNVDPKLTSEEMIRRKEEVIYHCTPDRYDGNPSSLMFLDNHFLEKETDILGHDLVQPDKDNIESTNSVDTILSNTNRCAKKHGSYPNFLLVDYYTAAKGGALAAAAKMNGVKYTDHKLSHHDKNSSESSASTLRVSWISIAMALVFFMLM